MSGIYLGKFSDFSGVKNIIYNDIDKQNCYVYNCIQMPLNFLNEIHNSFSKSKSLFQKIFQVFWNFYFNVKIKSIT